MEADSMHSTIERRLKNKHINVPADYVTVCREARKSPKPYSVEYLEHGFFKCFDGHHFYSSIRPGRGVGDPRVTDVKAYRYLPNGNIQYKLKFSNEWTELPGRKVKQLFQCFFPVFLICTRRE